MSRAEHRASRRILVAAISVLAGAVTAGASSLVVDNGDPGFTVILGTWLTGTYGVPWNGNYRWCSATSGSASGEVGWTPNLPGPGVYEVSVWYVAGTNRSPDAPFVVDHVYGSATVRINQQVAGSQWVRLGKYRFAAGTTGRVRLNNSASTGVVIADAVRFRSVGSDFDGDADVDLADFGHFQTCFNGPNRPLPDLLPRCEDADLDDDGDADLSDFTLFQGCFNGPNRPAASGCVRFDPIPPRPADAITGSQFKTLVTGMTLSQRDQCIHDEVSRGNIPDFLRSFCDVTVSISAADGPHTATYHVMPDYLAVGSDADFFRMPMMPGTAQGLADLFDCTLPTRKMVNDIWAQAAVKLAPYPFSPDYYDITSLEVFYQHNLVIEQQRAGNPLGLLVGGIKKDVVVTNLLIGHPDRVAIYGWHYLSGTPIQPLYIGHNYLHVDYSHGIRLVKQTMTVDGVERLVADVLKDPILCALLSDEGTIANPRY